jgi:hypothetical protein
MKKDGLKYIFDKNEKKDIIDLYLCGESIKDIGKKYNISYKPINRILIDNDIEIKNKNTYFFDKKEEKEMEDLYLTGKSLKNIGKKYGVCRGVIKRILEKNNVEIKSTTKYSANFEIFDEIDTEKKAYWLGFIAADGNIHNNTLSIQLGIQDREHLNKFLTFLDADYPIEDRKRIDDGKIKFYPRIRIFSKYIVNSLHKYNIIPNKSLILEPPKIKDNLISYFWRGMFDGDGSLYYHQNQDRWYVSLVGSKKIIESYEIFIKSFCYTNGNIKQYGNVYTFVVGGNQLVPIIVDKLYQNAKIYLDRKYKKYLEMKNMLNSNTMHPE